MRTLLFKEFVKQPSNPDDIYDSGRAFYTFGGKLNRIFYFSLNNQTDLESGYTAGENLTHGSLVWALEKFLYIFETRGVLVNFGNMNYIDFLKQKHVIMKLISWDEYVLKILGRIRFVPKINTVNELYTFIQKLKKDDLFFSNANRDSFDVAGRLSIEGKLEVAFWENKEKVQPYLGLIFQMMKTEHLDPTKYVYNFIDLDHSIKYNDLTKDTESNRTADEIKALQMKQHLDPAAKKKLIQLLGPSGFGSSKRAAIAQKAGFQTPAHFTFAKGESFKKFINSDTLKI